MQSDETTKFRRPTNSGRAPMTSTAFDPGSLDVRLTWRAGRLGGAEVELRRPNAATVLHGKPAEQAVRLLPMLYSICGKAQGLAADLALRAARGEAVPEAIDGAVRREGMREHLWRLLLDWPKALGLPTEEAPMAEAVRRLAEPGFIDWSAPLLERQRETLTAALPAVLGRLGPRIGSALAARCEALQGDTELGRGAAIHLVKDCGRGTVETARGLLQHDLRLEDGRMAELSILAPTDRHFADAGLLRAWLDDWEGGSPEELQRAAELVLLALDPCVPWQLSVEAA